MSRTRYLATTIIRLIALVALVNVVLPMADTFADLEVTTRGLLHVVFWVALVWTLSKFLVDTFRMLFTRPTAAVRVAPLGTARLRPPRGHPPSERSPEERERMARHEAGHAVVAHALGHQVTKVTIVPNPERQSGGHTIWRHRDDAPVSIDHVAVTYAGPLAEGSGYAPAFPLEHDDFTRMWRWSVAASVIDEAQRTPGEVIDAGARLARRLLDEHSQIVSRLAAALVCHSGRARHRRVPVPGVDARVRTSPAPIRRHRRSRLEITTIARLAATSAAPGAGRVCRGGATAGGEPAER